jgi:hypothetical protein
MKKLLAALCALPLLVGGVALAHVAEHRAGLDGSKVVPGPGDPDGSGTARIKSASEAETVCYKIRFKNIGKATYGHIHLGASGESGDKVVKLFASKKGKSSPVEGCRHGVPPATIERFHDNASYVDIHTERFPDGALRGQLRMVD